MKIKEFIENRDCSYHTVSMFIKRHSKEFMGHTGKGKRIDLDDVAISILEKRYPLPEAIQVVENPLLSQELQKKNEQIIVLQQELISTQKQLAELSGQQFLLEERTRENEDLKAENEKLKTELIEEKNKSWWQKLRNK